MAKIKQEKRKYLLLSPEDPQRSVYNQLTPPSFPSVFHYEESLLKRLDAIKPNRVTPRVGVARDILKKGLVLTIEDIENSEVTILDPAPVIDALSLAYYSGLPIRQEGDETYFEISERELEILCRVFNKREDNFLSGTLKLRGIRLKKENSFPEKPEPIQKKRRRGLPKDYGGPTRRITCGVKPVPSEIGYARVLKSAADFLRGKKI